MPSPTSAFALDKTASPGGDAGSGAGAVREDGRARESGRVRDGLPRSTSLNRATRRRLEEVRRLPRSQRFRAEGEPRVDWKSLADEDRALLRLRWRDEQLKICKTQDQKNYVRTMAANMQQLGSWMLGERQKAALIPASTSKRSRPNASGHMSRTTLRKVEDELRALGVLGAKARGRTNGKIIDVRRAAHPSLPSHVMRTDGVKVVRCAGRAIRRALAWFSFYFGRDFVPRKNDDKSTVKGKDYYSPEARICLVCSTISEHGRRHRYGGGCGPTENVHEALARERPRSLEETDRLVDDWREGQGLHRLRPLAVAA